ncbi:MAG: fumarate hydratase [Clostridia bacterium]|jgi:fumarate hydratase subunit alpha
MRKISSKKIVNIISDACLELAYTLNDDAYQAFKNSLKNEGSEIARYVLNELIDNADISKNENIPLCQDTGMVMCFVEIGNEVMLEDPLSSVINEGVKDGYEKGFLRKSTVDDPLKRVNRNDNTPAIIYIDQVKGTGLKIHIMLKGFGSENMGSTRMFSPSAGREGIVEYIVDTINTNGANSCPPLFIGVGIGGTMDYAAVLSKKALLRPVNEMNQDPYYAEMENEILERINKLNIGPAGYGGMTTACSVHIDSYPTHIAGLPVAITIQCCALRHKEIIL